nr:MAG TPA: hypothetical protein [Caudoviricetes sp.]
MGPIKFFWIFFAFTLDICPVRHKNCRYIRYKRRAAKAHSRCNAPNTILNF